MRDLTQKEIDCAPDWATHYDITVNGFVMYDSSQLFQCLSSGNQPAFNKGGLGKFSKLIPRKEFNVCIEPWFNYIDTLDALDNSISFYCYDRDNKQVNFKVYKEDAIAIAKPFKLTVGDLK